MSYSVWPQRRQPTRLPRPWDSPGKNMGVGCHFFLQCTKVESESEVAQSCPTLRDPMDCSLPGSSIHGIFQARVLEWVAIAFSENWVETVLKGVNSWNYPGTYDRSPSLESKITKNKHTTEHISKADDWFSEETHHPVSCPAWPLPVSSPVSLPSPTTHKLTLQPQWTTT